MSDVTIFAPSPTLTVTVEDHAEEPDIHVHPGGQGVWQARLLLRMGLSVTMCCALTGEIGSVLRRLLEDEGTVVAGVDRAGRGTAYVDDRRSGERRVIAEVAGDPLGRHELDELYGLTLREGIESGFVLLSGPSGDDTLPADVYRRLASDLREGGAKVVVDLSGERLQAAVDGGVDVLKVSEDELFASGAIKDRSRPAIMAAARSLRARGAEAVIVSRSDDPVLMLDAAGFVEVLAPEFEVVDSHGGGDALTAGVAAGMALGQSLREAILTGAAAGALNVTRHGLGTGDPEVIDRLRQSVVVRELVEETDAQPEQPVTGHVSPDGLAALAQPEEDG
jgi:1-phosphofructokinase